MRVHPVHKIDSLAYGLDLEMMIKLTALIGAALRTSREYSLREGHTVMHEAAGQVGQVFAVDKTRKEVHVGLLLRSTRF